MTEKRKIKIDIFEDNKKILSENEKVEVIAVSYDHNMAFNRRRIYCRVFTK